ncbi:MAG TPA: hypothetical protein PLI09_15600 [Candidatus Hydrogenedentes bacterium]|nr:hypothetical protein [Candidatus Hydrogenedentota bacterium]
MKRRYAAIITAALPCLAFLAVLCTIGDGIFANTRVPAGKELRAALAIRDNVTPFQKWGTEVFTKRYLTRYYAGAWYFTQSKKGDLEKEFVSCLDSALRHYAQVDLFLLAHTNSYIKWVEQIPEERRQRLRLVYNTGCHNLPQGEAWLKLGAKTYIGHPGVSSSSVFYYFFLRTWTRGHDAQHATDSSNRYMEKAFRLSEKFLPKFGAAETLMKESTASITGDTALRLEARQP